MAILSRTEAAELIKTPQNTKVLKKCREHEERIRFHVEPVLKKEDANKANNTFLEQVRGFLPVEKYNRFEQLFQYPVPTNELTEAIYSELRRAINGDGNYRKYNLASENQEDQFNELLNSYGHSEFWQNEAWDAFKTKIHSVLIIDQPKEEVTPPQPYCYLLDIMHVCDMKVSKKDAPCEYIIFKDPKNMDMLMVFDDEFYRTYEKPEKGSDYVLLSEAAHGLGYCPAKPFWSTNLNSQDNIQKLGGLSKSLSQLDKILFWETSVEYYNTYGVFPIVWAYEKKKDEQNSIGSDHIDTETLHGVEIPMNSHHPAYIESVNLQKDHNKNKGRDLLGAGSLIEIPAPVDNQDADLRDPFGYLQIQIDSLEFANSYLQKRKDLVFTYCVGNGREPDNEQAKNEKQIQSSFESKINILNWVADNFEIAEKWVLETKARIIFGSESVRSIEVKRGRRFYLKTELDLIQQYKEEKDSGLPMSVISNTRKMIAETKYKGNDDLLFRYKILTDLEPYPDLDIKDINAFSSNLDPDLIKLKLNFDSYIRRFEREELNLVRFGSLSTYEVKISSILDTLLGYVRPEEKQNQEGGVDGVDTPIDIEAESKAKLKGSVGGVQGILAVQTSVSQGSTQYSAGLELLMEIYGFSEEKARKILGTNNQSNVN